MAAQMEPINPADGNPQVLSNEAEKFMKENPSMDPVIIAWMLILQSVSIGHDAMVTMTKALNVAIQKQEKLIGDEAQFNLHTIPQSMLDKTVPQSFLNNLIAQNQLVSAIVNVLENKQNSERQIAQIELQSDSTQGNETDQSNQEGFSILQLLTQLSDQISRI